jgi:PKD repeat protein
MPDNTVRIQFFDRSVVFGGATKSTWLWTFENGNPATSIQQNPSVGFASSVTQSDVTLRVTDSDGYACTAGKTVDIIGLRTKLKEVIPR